MQRRQVPSPDLLRWSARTLTPPGLAARETQTADKPPKGEVKKFVFDHSKIFPGTVRDYWVYAPRQYDPAKPACLYVNQDGLQYKAPEVFDDLIHKKEMPVTIGVFVTARQGQSSLLAGA